jgi:hypothetical protein
VVWNLLFFWGLWRPLINVIMAIVLFKVWIIFSFLCIFVDLCLSVYPFCFWSLCCMSFFDLRILITPFVITVYKYNIYLNTFIYINKPMCVSQMYTCKKCEENKKHNNNLEIFKTFLIRIFNDNRNSRTIWESREWRWRWLFALLKLVEMLTSTDVEFWISL